MRGLFTESELIIRGRSWCLRAARSIARQSLTGKTLPVRGDPFRHELCEEPNALGFARFALGENPDCSIQMEIGARHSLQLWIGVTDEAR